MTAKTEWYEEILALDPASKVFLPFAQHLAAEGDSRKAVAILRQGLANHPEHAEARILLVHLLNGQKEYSAAEQEASALAGMLDRYPGFWETLARLKESTHREAGLLLRFVGEVTRGEALSLADVLARGLSAASDPAGQAASSYESSSFPLEDGETSVRDTASENPASGGGFSGETAPLNQSEDDPDEAVTLRTRSMADVLADQGDLAGALAIYEELALLAPKDEALGLRIAELQSRAFQSASQSDEHLENLDISDIDADLDTDTAALDDDEGHDVKWILENLASRLEARADR